MTGFISAILCIPKYKRLVTQVLFLSFLVSGSVSSSDELSSSNKSSEGAALPWKNKLHEWPDSIIAEWTCIYESFHWLRPLFSLSASTIDVSDSLARVLMSLKQEWRWFNDFPLSCDILITSLLSWVSWKTKAMIKKISLYHKRLRNTTFGSEGWVFYWLRILNSNIAI